jgi:predicted MFS family arabinose efflux permease
MTALCGLATGFTSLFLARVGVGIGEAGGSPPSQSLISDYFPPEKRASALSIFFLYIPLGFFVGFLLGGWIDEFASWRTAFFAVGLPGILLAIIVRLTIKEPLRGLSEHNIEKKPATSMLATMRYFLTRKSLIHISLAGSLYGIGAFGVGVWAPSFFMRAHEMESGAVGTGMALAYGLGGSLGTIAGGRIADALFRRTNDIRWYTWIPVFAVLLYTPLMIPVFLVNEPGIAFVFLFGALFFSHMFLGPALSMVQSLAGIHRRTQAAAFYLFLANLIAMSLGPLIIGMVSDRYNESIEALRYAILIVAAISALWAAFHFYLSSKYISKELSE